MYDIRTNNDGSVSVIVAQSGAVIAGPYTNSPKTSAMEKAKRRIRDLNKAREAVRVTNHIAATTEFPQPVKVTKTLDELEAEHNASIVAQRAKRQTLDKLTTGVYPHVSKKHYRRQWR